MVRLLKITGSVALLAVPAVLIKLFVLVPDAFRAGDRVLADCPGSSFDKSATVFDVLTICATNGVPQDKLRHAAHVAATWLDNDEDGTADNPLVNEKLKEAKATVVMSAEGFGAYGVRLHAALEAEGRFGQDLHAVETDNPDRRDASQEEIHHIIIGAGWARAYPDLFDERSTDSAVYRAWKKADAGRYYVYEAPDCDQPCKVMEFIYKSTAAYLGSDADLAETEFSLKNRADLRAQLPEIVALYEQRTYAYPIRRWPDGTYPHEAQVIVYRP